VDEVGHPRRTRGTDGAEHRGAVHQP
jgi:hypothetical protein